MLAMLFFSTKDVPINLLHGAYPLKKVALALSTVSMFTLVTLILPVGDGFQCHKALWLGGHLLRVFFC